MITYPNLTNIINAEWGLFVLLSRQYGATDRGDFFWRRVKHFGINSYVTYQKLHGRSRGGKIVITRFIRLCFDVVGDRFKIAFVTGFILQQKCRRLLYIMMTCHRQRGLC